MSDNEQIEKAFERWWEEFFEGESYERISVMHRLEREKFESAYKAGVIDEKERAVNEALRHHAQQLKQESK